MIETAKLQSCKTINLIATELGAPVYEKLGFITETEYLFFKDLNIQSVNNNSANIIKYQSNYRNQLSEIDYKVSGENRFIQLEKHLTEALVYMIDEEVHGYYLPTLGEGLIIAINSLAGVELMKIRLSISTNAAFPIENFEATELLLRLGHKPFKKAKRMRLGMEREWQPATMYNRIGGNIG